MIKFLGVIFLKVFQSKWFQVFPSLTTFFILTVGFFGLGCQGGEKDFFTNGFTCQESLSFGSGRDCSSASAAVSFASPNL